MAKKAHYNIILQNFLLLKIKHVSHQGDGFFTGRKLYIIKWIYKY